MRRIITTSRLSAASRQLEVSNNLPTMSSSGRSLSQKKPKKPNKPNGPTNNEVAPPPVNRYVVMVDKPTLSALRAMSVLHELGDPSKKTATAGGSANPPNDPRSRTPRTP
jgi:hypothetical protein